MLFPSEGGYQGYHGNRRQHWGRLVWQPTHQDRRCHRNSSDLIFPEKLQKNYQGLIHTVNITEKLPGLDNLNIKY